MPLGKQEPIINARLMYKMFSIILLQSGNTAHHKLPSVHPKQVLPDVKHAKVAARSVQIGVVLCWLSDASPASANVGWVSAGARYPFSGVVSGATVEQSAVALVIWCGASRAAVSRRKAFPRAGANGARAEDSFSPACPSSARRRVRPRPFRNRFRPPCARTTMRGANGADGRHANGARL